MSLRSLIATAAFVTALILSASSSWAQGETRYGVWINSTNPNNVMTYEPFGKGGMKITVSDPRKPEAAWSYTTMFDGKFAPVHNQENSETAVEIIDEKSTRIYSSSSGCLCRSRSSGVSSAVRRMNPGYLSCCSFHFVSAAVRLRTLR